MRGSTLRKLVFSAIAAALALGLVGTAGAIGFAMYSHFFYFHEFNWIRDRLQHLPGIALVQAGGNEDVTYEDLWFSLEVPGCGRMTLYDVARSDFDQADHVYVTRAGPFTPIVVRPDGGVGSAVDIGIQARDGASLAPGAKTTTDAIAACARIRDALAAWPLCLDRQESAPPADEPERCICIVDNAEEDRNAFGCRDRGFRQAWSRRRPGCP